jgi:polysaccharide chain length determinant protein (PEP-CTERM system associated)
MLPGKAYTVDEVIRIGRKRIWVMLLPLAIISAGTAVVARRIPDQYRSETSILVVPQRIPEAYVKSTVTMRIEDRLQAIKQQILSRTLLEETIKTFNLYARERKNGAIMEDLVSRMRGEINIQTVKLGDAFTISYVGEDPRTVMRVTEFLTASFINQSLKDRSSLAEGTNKFIENELEEARRRLLDHEKRLQEYNQRHSGELPTQQPSNMQAISNIQMQIQSVLNQIASLQDRRHLIDKELRSTQMMSELFLGDPTQPVTQIVPLIPTTAAGRLAAERGNLAKHLADKKTEDHPDVRSSRRLIAQLEKDVDAEALKQPVAAVKPKSLTPAQYVQQQKIENLQEELAMIAKQITDKQAEERRLREMNAAYQYRVDMAPTRASELVELTRDYATLQGIYSSLLAKKEESKTAANVEARQIGEQFRLLDPARMAEKPSKPNRPMINFMGIAAGFAVGLGLIGLLEYRDSSFKTDDEVANVLTLPVLAVVPLMQSDEDRTRASRRRLVMGVGFGSTVLCCLAVLVYTFVR